MDGASLAKFRKILGMLGSEHDGERANAARMATAILKQSGADWSAVAIGRDAGSSSGGSSAADWRMMANIFQRQLEDERTRTTRLSAELATATRRIRALEGLVANPKGEAPPKKKPPVTQGRQSGPVDDDELRDQIAKVLASQPDIKAAEFLRSVLGQRRWSENQRSAVIKTLRWARREWV